MYMYFSTPIPFGQYYLISDTPLQLEPRSELDIVDGE
jgi:hypothetical protein